MHRHEQGWREAADPELGHRFALCSLGTERIRSHRLSVHEHGINVTYLIACYAAEDL